MKNDPRPSKRMGVTRKLKTLPSEKVQHKALVGDGCVTVLSFPDFKNVSIYPVKGDVFVAVHADVFEGCEADVVTEVMKGGPTLEARQRGPISGAAKMPDLVWQAVRWNFLNTKPKEGNATGIAAELGFTVNDDQIRHRIKVETVKAAKAKAIGNEGEE